VLKKPRPRLLRAPRQGAKLNQGRATLERDLSAQDLAGITGPEEFEKAWKKVFGRYK
jgi:hypothetical protein